MKKWLIKDMYVDCSLQLRNFNQPGVAMSDCCRNPANSAVVMEDGKNRKLLTLMWRCENHRGVRRLEIGPSVDSIMRKA